jgi:hypothetical protein
MRARFLCSQVFRHRAASEVPALGEAGKKYSTTKPALQSYAPHPRPKWLRIQRYRAAGLQVLRRTTSFPILALGVRAEWKDRFLPSRHVRCPIALDAATMLSRLLHTDYSTKRLDVGFLQHRFSCALLGRYCDPKPELQTQPESRHLARNSLASIAWTWCAYQFHSHRRGGDVPASR